jgi:DNA modification methylase
MRIEEIGGAIIVQGDALESLHAFPDQSINCCVTSPPYWGLRDYGVAGQLGLEPTPQEYVEKMVAVFREVRRVLRDDGTLWLNLGDSYAANRSYQVNSTKGGPKHGPGQAVGGKGSQVPIGYKPKDLIGIPWRVAFALQADGWYLRQDIIWAKPNPMPESVRDRCTKSHEYIFLLAKSERYYFDCDAIKTPAKESSISRLAQNVDNQQGSPVPGKTNGPMKAVFGGRNKHAGHGHHGHEDQGAYLKNGVNKRDVWTVAFKPLKEAHFATFPPDLIEPCVLAGCPAGGTVLDPFGGAGTTGLVAQRHARQAVLLELNPAYVDLTVKRIAGEVFKVTA